MYIKGKYTDVDRLKKVTGHRMQQLRFEKRLSTVDFANMIQIQTQRIVLYEEGFMVPDIDVMIRYATFFGVSMDYLMGFKYERYSGVSVQVIEELRERVYEQVKNEVIQAQIELEQIRQQIEDAIIEELRPEFENKTKQKRVEISAESLQKRKTYMDRLREEMRVQLRVEMEKDMQLELYKREIQDTNLKIQLKDQEIHEIRVQVQRERQINQEALSQLNVLINEEISKRSRVQGRFLS